MERHSVGAFLHLHREPADRRAGPVAELETRALTGLGPWFFFRVCRLLLLLNKFIREV